MAQAFARRDLRAAGGRADEYRPGAGDASGGAGGGSHFVTFVAHRGRLYELDSCEPTPVDHGECPPGALLSNVAALITARVTALGADFSFNVLALANTAA